MPETTHSQVTELLRSTAGGFTAIESRITGNYIISIFHNYQPYDFKADSFAEALTAALAFVRANPARNRPRVGTPKPSPSPL